jgi:MFS family permease
VHALEVTPLNTTRFEPRAVHARVATSAVFLLNGLGVGSWAVRIPAVREALELSDATLGLVLLATAVGSLVSMPMIGRLCALYGSKRVTLIISLLFAMALPLPALAGRLEFLAIALFLYGAGNGGLDVAMNTQGTTVERAYERPILSSFHAFWSAGSLLGAAFGGLLAGLGFGPATHLLMVAGLIGLGFLVASRFLLRGDSEAQTETPARLQLNLGLLALGGVAFCALFSEGAIGDWSALYLKDELRASEGVAATGFAVFQLSMTAFRFAGDTLRARLGDARVVLYSGIIGAIGLGFGLVVHQLWAALIGFGLTGAGVAVIFPAALGLVSKLDGSARGPAIAWVSSVGYAGFLVGPPLIGLLSEATSLRIGLAVIALSGACIAALSSLVQPRS